MWAARAPRVLYPRGFSAIYEMGEHVNRALASPGRTIAPSAFVKNLRVLSKTFRKGRQEDAHEFARCLLEAMHKKCVDAARPKPPEAGRVGESGGERGVRSIPCTPPHFKRVTRLHSPFLIIHSSVT